MSNEKKVYYLAPTLDYDPDGGPIQLGNIITSPKKPADPLNTHRHSKPSQDSLYTPTQKHNVVWDRKKHQSGKFGIWTKFLSLFNINIGVSEESDCDSIYQFDRIETVEFMPTVEYLREQMAEPMVARYLKSGKSVYIITAVKVAYGARAKSTRSNAHSTQLTATVDVVASGAPGPVGSELNSEKGNTEGNSFGGSSPFVFAFRLRKVIAHEKNDISTEEYTKNAVAGGYGADSRYGAPPGYPVAGGYREDPRYGAPGEYGAAGGYEAAGGYVGYGGYGSAGPQVAEVMSFSAEGVANFDATADEFDLGDSEEVIDDENEECICVVA